MLRLQATGLTKAFGATQALAGANLDLGAGEVHALLGENGSGKSTFAKIVAGIHRPDAGDIAIDGTAATPRDVAHARKLGVAIVFQELSLAPDLSVADNIFLGSDESRSLFGVVRRRDERERCEALLDELGATIDPRRPIKQLSMAQKQIVEIAKALLHRPAILILDEPTSRLTELEKERLFQVVRQLRAAGTSILYVTHHLREVLQIADRVSVMRDGRVAVSEPISRDTTEDRLLDLLSARKAAPAGIAARGASPEALLSIESLRVSMCPDPVSLTVGRGEIVGLYGVVGCGREALAGALVGTERPFSGSVFMAGRPFSARNQRQAMRQGIGYLPSDRGENGILPSRSIRENLNLCRVSSYARFGFVGATAERSATERQLRELGVKYASADLPITTLSGGNQQKVLFGRAVAAAPKLLVLEDPTAGIDAKAKQDLYGQIRGWAAGGMGLLWLSSDVVETLTLCDRVYAMYGGRIVDEIVAPTLADEDRLISAVLGRGKRVAA